MDMDPQKELLKIFDDEQKHIGNATREEVHRLGLWHEAFHCWIVSREGDTDYIYLQLRSPMKKDYPNLLDITAAGHILAHESVSDGVREIKEELGIEVSTQELEFLGVLDYCVEKEHFIDKELAHIFLYRSNPSSKDFQLQLAEVSGLFKTRFYDFYRLWSEELNEIQINGFLVDAAGKITDTMKSVNKTHFVPHETSYYYQICEKIHRKLENDTVPM